MTSLADEMLARHVQGKPHYGGHAGGELRGQPCVHCRVCGTPYPCDAARAATALQDANKTILALLDAAAERDALAGRLRVATFVATDWRDAYLGFHKEGQSQYAIGTHPLSLVLAALDGETDYRQLGIPDDRADAFKAALAAASPAEKET